MKFPLITKLSALTYYSVLFFMFWHLRMMIGACDLHPTRVTTAMQWPEKMFHNSSLVYNLEPSSGIHWLLIQCDFGTSTYSCMSLTFEGGIVQLFYMRMAPLKKRRCRRPLPTCPAVEKPQLDDTAPYSPRWAGGLKIKIVYKSRSNLGSSRKWEHSVFISFSSFDFPRSSPWIIFVTQAFFSFSFYM
jgi:hypothetical protein